MMENETQSFVPSGGTGVRDNSGSGFGHIHFRIPDLYLAGNNAIGVKANNCNTNIIGYIDHILEIGTPTGTKAVQIGASGGVIKLTASEIIADEVYDINAAGTFHIQCPKLTGTRTGTPTSIGGWSPSAADKFLYSTGAGTNVEGIITAQGRALIDDADAATQRGTLQLANSTTAGRLARYTGTTGQTGQTSGVYEDGSGNVGFGTTNPGYKADIVGSLRLQHTGVINVGSARQSIFFSDSSPTNMAEIKSYDFDGTHYGLIFRGWNGSALADCMSVRTDGVSIGTINTGGKLNIVGGSAGSFTPSIVLYDNLSSTTDEGSSIDWANNSGGTVFGRIASQLNAAGVSKYDLRFSVFNGVLSEAMRIVYNGYLGIACADPHGPFEVKVGTNLRAQIGSVTAGCVTLSAGSDAFSVNVPMEYRASKHVVSVGAFGVGADPSANFHNVTSTRLAHLGAGTVQSDASGNLSVSSDERLKNIDGEFLQSIVAIRSLVPILYHYNARSGMDQLNQYVGFSKQNVQQHIPEAVGCDDQGFLTLSDRALLATVINAIKNLDARVTAAGH